MAPWASSRRRSRRRGSAASSLWGRFSGGLTEPSFDLVLAVLGPVSIRLWCVWSASAGSSGSEEFRVAAGGGVWKNSLLLEGQKPKKKKKEARA